MNHNICFRLPSYDDPPARSGARGESWRSHQLRHGLHHRLPPGLNRVTLWDRARDRASSASASNTDGTGSEGRQRERERVRHNAEIQGEEGASDEPRGDASSSSAGPRPPSSQTADPAAPSTSSGATGDQEQNQDIVRLSSHIERMQRICRQSLSSLGTVPMATQRRQVVRLQAIRRMLEDLQRQIRSLRDASYRELDRRARMEVGRRERERQLTAQPSQAAQAQAQSQTGGNATRTTTTLTDSRGGSSAATAAAARLRQRSTAVLSRIAAGGSHAHSRHRVPLVRRGGGGGRISPGSGAGRTSPGGARSARSAAVPRYEFSNEV